MTKQSKPVAAEKPDDQQPQWDDVDPLPGLSGIPVHGRFGDEGSINSFMSLVDGDDDEKEKQQQDGEPKQG